MIGSEQSNLRANLKVLGLRYGAKLVAAICDLVNDLGIQLLSQRPLIVRLQTDWGEIILNDDDGDAAQADLVNGVREDLMRGDPILFAGLGNGRLLEMIYHHQPKLLLGMLNPLYVVEQSPEVFAANLLIRDWTELIGSENVFFFIGQDGLDSLDEFFETSTAKQLPARIIVSSTAPQVNFQQMAKQLSDRRTERLEELKAKIVGYYSRIPARRFAELFSANPPRRPRVILITTRFSTVLQYSTRDIADVFEKLGWETLTNIEHDDCERFSLGVIADSIWKFKPDLVFQIDHARFEALWEILPEQLPFVTWVQDRMAQLYCPEAGERMGLTDIVFTIGGGEELRANYGYPGKQVFYMPMAINRRIFARLPAEETEPCLVYISHASKTPEMIVDEFEDLSTDAQFQKIRDTVIQPIRNIIGPAREAFDRGQPLFFEFQWQAIFDEMLRREGIAIADPALSDQLLNFIYVRLGNAIYRHQMLDWAARSGYPLKIYGSGWDKHPDLGKYAAGPLEHGEALANVYHRSRINLQAVITCNIHQRVFEGISAGGFFLLRHHPSDRATLIIGQMQGWLADQRGRSVKEVISSPELTDEQRSILRFLEGRWLGRFETLDDSAIELLTHYGSFGGLQAFLGSAIDKVYFNDRDEFVEKVNFFFEHPQERREIVLAMQQQLKNWETDKILRHRLDDISEYMVEIDPAVPARS